MKCYKIIIGLGFRSILSLLLGYTPWGVEPGVGVGVGVDQEIHPWGYPKQLAPALNDRNP